MINLSSVELKFRVHIESRLKSDIIDKCTRMSRESTLSPSTEFYRLRDPGHAFSKKNLERVMYMHTQSLGTCVANLKPVTLTVLELLEFNIQTRNTLDCDQSNVYSSRAVFSAISQGLFVLPLYSG